MNASKLRTTCSFYIAKLDFLGGHTFNARWNSSSPSFTAVPFKQIYPSTAIAEPWDSFIIIIIIINLSIIYLEHSSC